MKTSSIHGPVSGPATMPAAGARRGARPAAFHEDVAPLKAERQEQAPSASHALLSGQQAAEDPAFPCLRLSQAESFLPCWRLADSPFPASGAPLSPEAPALFMDGLLPPLQAAGKLPGRKESTRHLLPRHAGSPVPAARPDKACPAAKRLPSCSVRQLKRRILCIKARLARHAAKKAGSQLRRLARRPRAGIRFGFWPKRSAKTITHPSLKPAAKDAGEADSTGFGIRDIKAGKDWYGPRSGCVNFGKNGLLFEGGRLMGWPHGTGKGCKSCIYAPCSRKAAMDAPASGMALHPRHHGWCELVPLHQACCELAASFLLVPLPEPDDILLLMARLRSQNRLSRAEISRVWELFQKASPQPRGGGLPGIPRMAHPEILHCKGFALSPAVVRSGPLPPQLRQR